MKANLRARNEHEGNDAGVSPVIAVILMVAITVVLAATVYVWVSGFSSDEQGAENAQVRATGFDKDNNGATDSIRLTLVRGENAPYAASVVDMQALDQSNTAFTNLTENLQSPSDAFDGTDEWAVGEVLYADCRGDGPHQLTVSIRDSVVLDERISCDE